MIEHANHHQARAFIDSRGFALSRSADAERHMRAKSFALHSQPLRNLRSRVPLADTDDKKRLAIVVGPFLGAPPLCPEPTAWLLGNHQPCHEPVVRLDRRVGALGIVRQRCHGLKKPGESRHILLGVVPTDVDHGLPAAPPAVGTEMRIPPAA
jgi:hypothetical protein